MYQIQRFGGLWATAIALPLNNVRYTMPADTAQRTFFRKSDGGLYTPEGSWTVRMAPPDTFLYRGAFVEQSAIALRTAIKNLSSYLGMRSYLWLTDDAGSPEHLIKSASMQRVSYDFASDAYYFVANVSIEFALEHEGWLMTPVVLTAMQVTGNANVIDIAGNTMTIVHDGNMDNYRALDITISPTGGNLTSVKVTCLDYLTGAITRTTLIYAGTVAAGEHLMFDWSSNAATVNGVVVRPVTRGTTAPENTMAEWGMLTKKTATVQGGARLNIICTGSATFYEAEVYHFGMYAL